MYTQGLAARNIQRIGRGFISRKKLCSRDSKHDLLVSSYQSIRTDAPRHASSCGNGCDHEMLKSERTLNHALKTCVHCHPIRADYGSDSHGYGVSQQVAGDPPAVARTTCGCNRLKVGARTRIRIGANTTSQPFKSHDASKR